MICQKCNKEYPEGAKFCGGCGASLVGATVSSGVSVPQPQSQPQVQQPPLSISAPKPQAQPLSGNASMPKSQAQPQAEVGSVSVAQTQTPSVSQGTQASESSSEANNDKTIVTEVSDVFKSSGWKRTVKCPLCQADIDRLKLRAKSSKCPKCQKEFAVTLNVMKFLVRLTLASVLAALISNLIRIPSYILVGLAGAVSYFFSLEPEKAKL